MLRKSILVVLLALLGQHAYAEVKPIPAATRGELLYTTHCIACHSAEMHWRDKKLATDWRSLAAQVQRWQDVIGLGWRIEDVDEVVAHLNSLHYHYPRPD